MNKDVPTSRQNAATDNTGGLRVGRSAAVVLDCRLVRQPASARLRKAEADALGRQLGLVVKLEAVRHLRPGVVLYDGIELADPETGQTILRSRCLEVAWRRQADSQGQLRPTLCVIASQPEVETAAIGRVWQWLQRLLENSPGRPPANVQISADAVTLRADGGSQTMTEVAALLETLPGRSSAQIDFRLVGAETPEPACIRVVRSREVSPPASRFDSRPATANCRAASWPWPSTN